MRWTKGQEECMRRGGSLISQPHSGDTFYKHPLSLILKFCTAELTIISKEKTDKMLLPFCLKGIFFLSFLLMCTHINLLPLLGATN